ncbi:hypothetical protein ACFLFF_27015 [Brevibacillus reuszeri]|uniref:hypothetical protein n=1 Tax=Brevibacillus reuszeri TaxID=54915 RepID=UPI00366DEAD3
MATTAKEPFNDYLVGDAKPWEAHGWTEKQWFSTHPNKRPGPNNPTGAAPGSGTKPTTPAPAPTPTQPSTPNPTTPAPSNPAPNPATPKPTPPTYTPTPYKQPQYNPLSYESARNQAANQLDPMYQQALQEIQRQRAVNSQQAGDIAAARGVGRSGLAADLQNKVNIAAMQQGSNLSAQRATQEAQMAQSLMDQDYSRQQANRDFALREYLAQNQLGLGAAQFDWQKQLDSTKLGMDKDQLDWQRQLQQNQFDWQKQMGQSDIDYRNQQSKQQQEQYNRDYILRQLQAMANAGIDISKLQEDWLLKPWG